MTHIHASQQQCCPEPKGEAKANIISFVRGLAKKFKTSVSNYSNRKRDRDAFAHMLSLDETMLKDIGVSRDDIIWASKLPLSENASQELYKLSLKRRKKI